MPTTPGTPPRRVPDRGSTRPGTRRGARLAAGQAAADPGSETTTPLDEATLVGRRRAISGLALSMTHRLIALAATIGILAISFISSYGVYLDQQRLIAETQAQIDQHNAEIARLQDEFERWNDPAYVKARARDQLGWVMPGEVGYRVVDENGQVIGGTVGQAPPVEEPAPQVWYEQLWASLRAADQPALVETTPTEPAPAATIGPDGQESPR